MLNVRSETRSMSAIYGFADFEVDLDHGKLRRRGYTVMLQDQPFRLLALLLGRAGTVVTREEIQAHLWPQNTYVEFDKSLRVAVSKLREALRDSASEPIYIETLPRRGYRFIAQVHELSPGTGKQPSPAPIDSFLPAIPAFPLEDKEPGIALQPAQPEMRAIHPVLHTPFRNIALWAAAVLVVVAVPIYLNRGRIQHIVAPKVAANSVVRRSVAVIGLRNLSGSAEDVWLSTALAEMLSNELSASDRLRVISGEEVARAGLSAPPMNTPSHQSLAQYGNQLGADMIVFGSYTVFREHGASAPRLRLDLRVENLSSDAPPVSLVESGLTTDMFALVSASGSELRQRFSLGDLPADAASAVKRTLPEDPRAAQFFAEGLAHLRDFDPPGAKDLLRKAARIEPGHAGTHQALAEAWHVMGYEKEARTEAALAVRLGAGLPRQELLNMQGELALFSNDWPHAAGIFHSLLTFYPDNIDYGLRLAQVQTSQSDAAGSLITLKTIASPGLSRADQARIELSIAQTELQVDDFRLSIAAADRAIQTGVALDQKLVRARGLWIKASALERLGKDQDSLAASAESQNLYRAAGDKQGLGIAILMSGDVLYDKSRTAEARKSFQDSLQLFREIGQRRNQGVTLERIGNTYYDEGKLDESRESYRQALDAYKDLHWDSGIASVIGNIANVQDTEGDIAGALKSNEECLAGFERTADTRGAASTLANLGNLELERGALDRASSDFDRAAAIQRQIGYSRGLAFATVGQGDVLLARNDLAGATRQYEQAARSVESMDEPSVLAIAKVSLGIAILQAGKAGQAVAPMQQAADLSLKAGNHGSAAYALAWLARAQLRQGHIPEALAAAQHAVAESRLQFGPRMRVNASLALARVLLAQGHTEAAKAQIHSQIQMSQRYGYSPLEMEARILLAQTSPSSSERSHLLQALTQEAARKGWKLLATSGSEPAA